MKIVPRTVATLVQECHYDNIGFKLSKQSLINS